jgi:hypothetical protein
LPHLTFSDIVPEPADALHDAMWLLRLAAALFAQIGLLHLLSGDGAGGAVALAAGAAFIAASAENLWARAFLLAAWCVLLSAGFWIQKNPCFLLFLAPLAWQLLVLLVSYLKPAGREKDAA